MAISNNVTVIPARSITERVRIKKNQNSVLPYIAEFPWTARSRLQL
jgi:hypothetical protein